MLYAVSWLITVVGAFYLNGYRLKDNWMFLVASLVPVLNTLTAAVFLLVWFLTRNFDA